ncbi:MAG: glycosyltransferase family 2 protein [Bacteroidales bacterium]
MVKISALIITYNEERNIERCINSLKDIADEIIVIDSFSTDQTEIICNRLETKFIKHKFEGHIQQKNWAITQASYPYILSLDADEVISESLKKSILLIKNNWYADGYTFNRITSYCGKWIKHGGWYPDMKLRLWDSRKGKWSGINPHDRFEMQNDSKIVHLKGNLLHYSYHTLKDHTIQVEKFTDITAKALFEQGKHASFIQLYLGSNIKFIRNYFLKLGFLDGYHGYRIAKISAYATFLKYAKLKEMYQKNKS